MKLYRIFIFLVVQEIQGYERSELRMDDNVDYLKHQDIVKAIKNSQPPWLYGYSKDPWYSNDNEIDDFLGVQEGHCIYFRKEDINETNVHFTKHQPKEQPEPQPKERQELMEGKEDDAEGSKQQKDDKETITHLYGKFFNSTIKNGKSVNDYRNTSNGITVTNRPDETEGKSYKLLYSDYRHCSILRPFVLPKDKGPLDDAYLSYPGTKAHCILFLSDAAARGDTPPPDLRQWLPRGFNKEPQQMPSGLPAGMPLWCRFMFRSLCGDSSKLNAIFKKSCPKIPTALGC